jgi:hypothetical protein
VEHHTLSCSNFGEVRERVDLLARTLASGMPGLADEYRGG